MWQILETERWSTDALSFADRCLTCVEETPLPPVGYNHVFCTDEFGRLNEGINRYFDLVSTPLCLPSGFGSLAHEGSLTDGLRCHLINFYPPP